MRPKKRPKVLDPDVPLEHRFAQVAQLSDDAHQHPQPHAMPQGQVEPQPQEHHSDKGRDQVCHRALDGLVGTDQRGQLRAAQEGPHEERGGVAQPDRDDRKQNAARASRERPGVHETGE